MMAKSVLTENNRLDFLEPLAVAAQQFGYQELSEKTGIPRTHFYRLFSPDGNPSLDTILKIAKAIGFELKLELTSVKRSSGPLLSDRLKRWAGFQEKRKRPKPVAR